MQHSNGMTTQPFCICKCACAAVQQHHLREVHLSTCFLLQITLQPGGGLLFRDQHDIGSGLPASAAKLAALWPDGAPPSLKAHTQPASSLGLPYEQTARAVCSYEALPPGGMTNGDVAVKVLRRCRMLHQLTIDRCQTLTADESWWSTVRELRKSNAP